MTTTTAQSHLSWVMQCSRILPHYATPIDRLVNLGYTYETPGIVIHNKLISLNPILPSQKTHSNDRSTWATDLPGSLTSLFWDDDILQVTFTDCPPWEDHATLWVNSIQHNHFHCLSLGKTNSHKIWETQSAPYSTITIRLVNCAIKLQIQYITMHYFPIVFPLHHHHTFHSNNC